MRQINPLDTIISQFDATIKTLTGTPHTTSRPYPAENTEEVELTANEKKHAAGLMRVNYSGEVAAQALYQGQALTAKLEKTKVEMEKAAIEELEHLTWCKTRLDELDSNVSLLNPIWYLGSLMIGISAGLIGDQWSLGFVVETEKQVVAHLEKHMGSLPEKDQRSRKIISQMKVDEAEHAEQALQAGAKELPEVVKRIMSQVAKVMTKTAYHI